VAQTDGNKGRTHTLTASPGREVAMSVSSACLTVMLTNAGNLSSQNQERGPCGVNVALTPEEHPRHAVTHDRRRPSVEADMTSRGFTHFLVSAALRV